MISKIKMGSRQINISMNRMTMMVRQRDMLVIKQTIERQILKGTIKIRTIMTTSKRGVDSHIIFIKIQMINNKIYKH